MIDRPASLNLSNWRQPPHSRWAFHHVREIIPTAPIYRGAEAQYLAREINPAVAEVRLDGLAGDSWSLRRWLDESSSDALLVAHRGKLVHEWYADEAIETHPHIVFSVSKSITATLAGVLVERGLIDPARPVIEYVPELEGSAYADATLQQVMDMAVRVDFDEDYLATMRGVWPEWIDLGERAQGFICEWNERPELVR